MKRLTNDLNRYKQVISHNKLHTENEKLANDLNRNKQNKYQQEIEPKYTEKINNLNNNLDRHQHEINTLNNNISCSKANYGLEAINDKLRKEASSYQLALEDTLYFHLSSFINIDNDKIQGEILEYIDNCLEIKEDDDLNNPNNQEKYNNVIKAIPTKIRQQVYTQNLNQLMTGYCYIKDNIKRKNIEDMAENLIKDITRIFKFRLLVQGPKYETH
ncbi:13263_t:CDS:2 [Entrophospora sp. SA101]|nr:11423_t:CDS:2 [Entrophospora sp. SA101]CAJ0826785.1 13263_t:CDS:2 [Entrophospora sp. SA101]